MAKIKNYTQLTFNQVEIEELSDAEMKWVRGGTLLPPVSQSQVPRFQVPQFQVPQFQMPQFQVPQFQVPQFQMPQFEIPKFN
ncbi:MULTISPECIES: hypothetical protein [Nostoc]|uniref:Uncharacterized protein n=2 Tax=Nostoc TaxID=1177 RepID=A0ABR8I7S9_9NOSO|nr:MULTISPECIES: hypothetical protein [Nostoc]MBD2564501.1 hypothetical protein [Nostoc linckia FACHB-391]MBD2646841.1 hypothetical protein [Nostoc foliaceum FACHB-393]